ncbi:MAG: DoxX family protein [Actinomycetales bacterium]|nr:DoxX family protein [Actinomycetales bacterium]
MKTLTYVLLGLLVLISTFSAIGKLRKDPRAIEPLTQVGVKANQVPVLAALELAAAAGLLIGLKLHPLALAAATGLSLYFIGAVIAHLRVKDKFAAFAPAFGLALISIATTLLINSNLS